MTCQGARVLALGIKKIGEVAAKEVWNCLCTVAITSLWKAETIQEFSWQAILLLTSNSKSNVYTINGAYAPYLSAPWL